MKAYDVYKEARPVKGKHLTLQLIAPEDAEDLLCCYSDEKAAPLFNDDNCTGGFFMRSVDDVRNAIRFWLKSYQNGEFVRYAIVAGGKAVGTIELFNGGEHFGVPQADVPQAGVLRLDLASAYETEAVLSEVLHLVIDELAPVFRLEAILTKAAPVGEKRRAMLTKLGFVETQPGEVVCWPHWWLLDRETLRLQQQADQLGCCGLFCPLCLEAPQSGCAGCQSDDSACDQSNCHHYLCCQRKGIRGCWECDEPLCETGVLAPDHAARNRAFVLFARRHGPRELVRLVLKNQQKGVKYGFGLDYDRLKTEDEVFALLRQADE